MQFYNFDKFALHKVQLTIMRRDMAGAVDYDTNPHWKTRD